jgi:hypothetical protein
VSNRTTEKRNYDSEGECGLKRGEEGESDQRTRREAMNGVVERMGGGREEDSTTVLPLDWHSLKIDSQSTERKCIGFADRYRAKDSDEDSEEDEDSEDSDEDSDTDSTE